MKKEIDQLGLFGNARVKRAIREYKKEGYKVITAPSQEQLPLFLKNSSFIPDMLAIGKKQSVIIEIKSSVSLVKRKHLDNLAKITKDNNWRLDIIILKSEKSEKETGDLSTREIFERLNEIREMQKSNFDKAAYLLAWSTFEAAIRIKLRNERMDIDNEKTTALIKNLYSYGLVETSGYKKLEEALKIRNSLVHGYRLPSYNKDILNYIVELSTKFIKSS